MFPVFVYFVDKIMYIAERGFFISEEAGEGYSDVLVETDDGETGIVLELKYADDGNLETACLEALEQIETNNYEEVLQDDGVENIIKYGIAFYKKKCRVKIKK